MSSHRVLRSPISAALAVTATAGALLAPGLASAPAARASPAAGPAAVISIGDSIASGEGGRLAGDPYSPDGATRDYNDTNFADKSAGNPDAFYQGTWNYSTPSGWHAGGCHRSSVAPRRWRPRRAVARDRLRPAIDAAATCRGFGAREETAERLRNA